MALTPFLGAPMVPPPKLAVGPHGAPGASTRSSVRRCHSVPQKPLRDMPKPTKPELNKYEKILRQQLGVLTGDVGSLRDEALRAAEQDNSVDHLADQGSDNYDQSFLLGLIENEEETIALIEEALERVKGKGDYPFGQCIGCVDESSDDKPRRGARNGKKPDPWIPKARLEYLPWARYCVRHQEEAERSRESA